MQLNKEADRTISHSSLQNILPALLHCTAYSVFRDKQHQII